MFHIQYDDQQQDIKAKTPTFIVQEVHLDEEQIQSIPPCDDLGGIPQYNISSLLNEKLSKMNLDTR